MILKKAYVLEWCAEQPDSQSLARLPQFCPSAPSDTARTARCATLDADVQPVSAAVGAHPKIRVGIGAYPGHFAARPNEARYKPLVSTLPPGMKRLDCAGGCTELACQ
jgi:hypothetical protein